MVKKNTENPDDAIPEFTRVMQAINSVLTLSQKNTCNDIDTYLAKTEIATVIPAYNEELTIGMVVLLSLQHSHIVIVVDDGSTDRTREIAKLAGAEVLSLENNRGKAFALRTGLTYARSKKYHVIVTIDGNGLYNPNEIPYLTTLIRENEADIVLGTRFLRNPDIVSSFIFTDKLPGFIAYGERSLDLLNDFLCRAIPQSRVSEILIEKGLRVAEIPITVRKKEKRFGPLKGIIVALPAYNEENSISEVIKGALRYTNTVLVIDDGSSDKTAFIAAEAGAIVIQHETNVGYGGALNTIFSIARKMEAEVLITMDSDGQHNPTDIKQLLREIESGADVVIGSRFLGISNTVPYYRRIGMRILDKLTSAAGVKKITDSQSGFRAYNRKAIQVLDLCSTGMAAGSEILIQISEKNLELHEVPINVRYDIEDTSTHNPVYHGISVLSNIFGRINYKNPIIIFGIPAIIMALMGFFLLVLFFLSDIDFIRSPIFLIIMSLILIFIGIIIGLEGIIYNYYINRSKSGTRKY